MKVIKVSQLPCMLQCRKKQESTNIRIEWRLPKKPVIVTLNEWGSFVLRPRILTFTFRNCESTRAKIRSVRWHISRYLGRISAAVVSTNRVLLHLPTETRRWCMFVRMSVNPGLLFTSIETVATLKHYRIICSV